MPKIVLRKGIYSLAYLTLFFAVCGIVYKVISPAGTIHVISNGVSVYVKAEEPVRVNEAVETAIPLRISNGLSRTIALYPTADLETRGRFELPLRVGPYEHKTGRLIIDARGRAGFERFGGYIFTDGPDPARLGVFVQSLVSADTLYRHFDGGLCPSETDLQFVFHVDNIPASRLKQTIPVSANVQNAHAVSVDNRSVDFTISTVSEPLNQSGTLRQPELAADLLFDSPELRRLRATVTFRIIANWEIPERVTLNPINSPNGQTSFEILFRGKCAQDVNPEVQVEQDQLHGLKVKLQQSERVDDPRGFCIQRFPFNVQLDTSDTKLGDGSQVFNIELHRAGIRPERRAIKIEWMGYNRKSGT